MDNVVANRPPVARPQIEREERRSRARATALYMVYVRHACIYVSPNVSNVFGVLTDVGYAPHVPNISMDSRAARSRRYLYLAVLGEFASVLTLSPTVFRLTMECGL